MASIDLVKRRVRLVRLLIPGMIVIVFIISMQGGAQEVAVSPSGQQASLQELRRTGVWGGPLPSGAVQKGLSEVAFCTDPAYDAAIVKRNYSLPPVADVFSFYRPLLTSQGYEVRVTREPAPTLIGIKPVDSKFTDESWVNVTADDENNSYTVSASGDYRKVTCE